METPSFGDTQPVFLLPEAPNKKSEGHFLMYMCFSFIKHDNRVKNSNVS